MTTFLFLTWFTATGYMKTDVIPMPNMEVCKKVELRMKNPPAIEVSAMGIRRIVKEVPKETRCETF